jgi:sialate O-acetylesterase
VAAAALALAACQWVSIAQPAPLASGLRLPRVFSDNMILQQDATVPIWGWGDEGDRVTVTFGNQKVSARVKNGKWAVKLRNLKPGGPEVLSIHGKTALQLTNVLVGEVWLAGGQSNMEFPLNRAFQSSADIAAAANPMIHLLKVPKKRSDSPVEDVGANWKECNPDSAASFSAVAYYFGRDLQKALQTPVGIIESDWGGTPAEAWMRPAVLEANPRYEKEIIQAFAAARQKYEESLASYNQEKNQAKANGQTFTNTLPRPPSWQPGELYNGMIAPLIPYAIKGVIWYQGEANADPPSRARQYRSLFPDMIRNWRADWNEGAFAFLLVQLAPFRDIQREPGESSWALLREAQLEAAKMLPDVGMAVITDVGEEHDIHPKKKQPAGARLSLAARGIAYKQKIEYSGPVYKAMEVNGDKILLTFDHAGGGLEARGSDLTGFAVCGPDRKFVWAIAEIEEPNKVVVHCPAVPNPIAVRYGWANYPVVNLWNKDGLPASPFRTDDFSQER